MLLCTVLGGLTSFLVSSQMDPTYEASTLLIIGSSIESTDPNYSDMLTGAELAQTYAELVKTRPLLEATMLALSLPGRPAVTVTLVRNTQLMRIAVQDTDPHRAAATADELARQLILQSPSDPQREEQAYREFAREQVSDLQRELVELSQALQVAKDSANQEDMRRLQEELSLRRTNLNGFLYYLQGSSVNSLRVVEPAVLPLAPIKPKVQQNTALAAIVGLMLAAGAAFLVEYLDDSIRSPRDVEELLEMPALGVVADIPTNGHSPESIAMQDLVSPFTEAFRVLRMNLRYSLSSDVASHVFLVTSPGPGQGKSTIVTNLGAVSAQFGQKTVLVDADMRRPRLHKILGCPNVHGLSSLLVGEVANVQDVMQATSLENLYVVPCGPKPPNPAELLASPRMEQVIQELSALADVVVVDSPPILAVADAAVLSRLCAGTLLVLQAGRTGMMEATQAVENLRKVGSKVLGGVLNRVKRSRQFGYGYGYNYGYYYSYSYAENGEHVHHRRSLSHRLVSMFVGEERHNGHSPHAAGEPVVAEVMPPAQAKAPSEN
jgi:non-specific protein-tyrosine kinase